MTGAELIAKERQRQIDEEGYDTAHDDREYDHGNGQLALAAACYATPLRLYVKKEVPSQVSFDDPWPSAWSMRHDKRREYGGLLCHSEASVPDPKCYTDEERLDLLVKAGALIAAEIDRLNRLKEKANDGR